MIDVDVELFFIEKFKELGEPLVTKPEKDSRGNLIYPNLNFENQSFKRPADMYWFNLWFVPTLPMDSVSLCANGKLWTGIFQIDICAPKNIGTKAMYNRFKAIQKHFKTGFIAPGIRVISLGRSTIIGADDYTMLPVSLVWEAYLREDD